MKLRKGIEMFRAYRAGAPLGDVATLKFDAMASPPPGMNERLHALRGYLPEIDLDKLRQLPTGTLGREHARFLDANGIVPLVISDHIAKRFFENPWVLRYTTTHDLHHVISGFDTGLPGEAGAFAFTVGQGSAPGGMGYIWMIRLLYPLITPTQARKVWHNVRVGLELGKRAALLIAEPLESFFEEPLESVRIRLGLPRHPASAGVEVSGRSLFQEWLYPTAHNTDHR